jgi:hypothetical protein
MSVRRLHTCNLDMALPVGLGRGVESGRGEPGAEEGDEGVDGGGGGGGGGGEPGLVEGMEDVKGVKEECGDPAGRRVARGISTSAHTPENKLWSAPYVRSMSMVSGDTSISSLLVRAMVRLVSMTAWGHVVPGRKGRRGRPRGCTQCHTRGH